MAIKIKRVLSCFVVLAILMSVMPVTGFTMNNSNNAIGALNRSTGSEKAFTVTESTEVMMPFFDNNTTDKYRSAIQTKDGNSSGDCVRMPNVDMPHIYLNETQVGGAANRASGSDTILVEVSNETRDNVNVTGCDVWVAIDDDTCVGYCVYVDGVYILTEGQGGTPDGYCAFSVTEGTHTLEIRKNGRSASKTINFVCGTSYTWVSMPDNWCGDGGSCDVWVAIDDDTCVGYCVYVDGVYILTEGQGGTPDGYCAFSVTEGTHTLEIRKNGRSASKTINFVCGTSYTWVSMPDHWCDDGGSQCDNPPTVSFDKSSYYEGDKVQITVSTSLSSVYYEIKDCSGTVRETGYTSGGTISYTIPDGSTSSCCYWTICFYWDEGGDPVWPAEAAGNINVESYQCTKCYNFYVCPDTCDAYVEIEDNVCFGYEVYVDGARQFTEGQGTTPDGYCAFTVSDGYHTIEIRKDGCSEIVFSYQYFQCDGQYKKILQNYWCDCNKPDLLIQDISWSPSSPQQGNTITYTVTIKNQGSGSAGTSTVKYYVDGSYVTSDSVPQLSAGSTSTQTFTGTVNECGNVQVKAVADANSAVTESAETNNERTETVNIECPDPDLIIQDISWSPSSPQQGNTITYTVTIKNQGSGSAGTSTVKYYVDGSYVTSDSVPSLSAGSTSTQTFTGTVNECGNVQVKAVADANSAVTESAETNNERTETVNIECPDPDLIIQDISWSPSSPQQGNTITYTVTIKNQGSGSAGTSTVKYYIDGSYVDSDSVPVLSAGSTSTQTFTGTVNKCGDIQVKVVADTNNVVDESEEGNNEKLKTLSVACQLMEGDVTQDGHVTITDARSIAQYKAGLISLNPNQLQCADTTDDGAVTMVDMMHILQWKVDPDRTVGVLYKPLWESPADDGMRKPVE